jgi:hypothetical protein
VLEEVCRNQKFNASDTSPLPMNRFWPELGRWFGVPEIEGPELDESKLTVIDPGDVPTPLGYDLPPPPFFPPYFPKKPQNFLEIPPPPARPNTQHKQNDDKGLN